MMQQEASACFWKNIMCSEHSRRVECQAKNCDMCGADEVQNTKGKGNDEQESEEFHHAPQFFCTQASIQHKHMTA